MSLFKKEPKHNQLDPTVAPSFSYYCAGGELPASTAYAGDIRELVQESISEAETKLKLINNRGK